MAKKALLVGLNYEGTPNELAGCHNDVHNIEHALMVHGFVTYKKLLDDASSYTGNITETTPNRQNFVSYLTLMLQASVSGDCIYVHYSGHGSYSIDRPGPCKDELDGKDEELCFCDGDLVDDDLASIIKNNMKAGVSLIFTLDCCHSATALDLPLRYLGSDSFSRENNSIFPGKIISISGCLDNQTSADAYINRTNQGALTWALVEAFHECKPIWDWKMLLASIQGKLKGKYSQVPQLCMNNAACIADRVLFLQ